MNIIVAHFQEIFSRMLDGSSGLLVPADIEFKQYHQSLIADICHSAPEIYYHFETSDEAGYLLFFTSRGAHRLLCKCPDETNAALAMIAVYLKKCVPSLERTFIARNKVKEEIKLENFENAQKIVLKTVGYDSVSFNRNEYSKISLLSIDDKKTDLFFHEHTICPGPYLNKPSVQRGYHMALVYGYYLWAFRKLCSIVQNETDLSEFEYLYLTGHSEK